MTARIRPRADTAANWTAANPTLFLREIGRETDTGRQKFGDGVTAWNALSYATIPKQDVGLGNVENTALSTWPGTTNITTLGKITTGSFPYAQLTGTPSLGTIASQNANNVAITGGAINGATIGATTPAAITGTTLTASTSVTAPIVRSESGGLSLAGASGYVAVTRASTSSTFLQVSNTYTGTTANDGLQIGYGSTSSLARIINYEGDSISFATDSSAADQFRILHTASANRYITATGSNGGNPTISATGGSLAIGSRWTAAGQTCADLGTVTTADINGGTIDGAVIGGSSAAAATVTTLTTTGRTLLGGAAGAESLRVVVRPGGINCFQVIGGVAGGSVQLSAQGAETDITAAFYSKGQGALAFGTDNGNVFAFEVAHVAGGDRRVVVSPSNGGDPTISTSAGRLAVNAVLTLKSYTVATLPTATARGVIYVSDESGGAVLAFADGTNWRRVTDRAIVS